MQQEQQMGGVEASEPEPIGNGDHHVCQRSLECDPGIQVKDEGQALPPQHLGLAKEHAGSTVQMAAKFCIRCAIQSDACSIDSVVEAHQQLPGRVAALQGKMSV